jgi:hypothetical protein
VVPDDDLLAAQKQLFGPDGFATTVDHVAHIEQSLGIYDLAQFTPAAVGPITAPYTMIGVSQAVLSSDGVTISR